MKKNNLALIITLLLATQIVFGQSKTGTTIGQFLKIEPSARAAAIGNAGTALYGEAVASYYNPASLGRLEHSDFQFTYNSWLADIVYNYAIAAVKVENIGTFSLQVTSLNSGEIDVRTVEQPLGTGEKYSVNNFAIGLGYGLMLTDRVSIGMQINYLQESIWHSTLADISFNFGVQYQVEKDGLMFGASVANFGPRAKYDGRDLYIDYDFDPAKYGDNNKLPAELRTDSYSLPTLFRVGIAYPLTITESNKVLFAIDATHPNDSYERLNLGAEWNYLNTFSLRAGYRDLFLEDSEGGLMLGCGALYEFSPGLDVRFDYAWSDYGRLNQTHRFTVGIGFN